MRERYEIKIPKVEYECQDDSNLDLLKLSEAPGVRPRGISSSVNQFADVRLPELVDSYHQHKNAQTPKKASPSKPVVKPPNSLNKPYHTPHHLQDSMIYNSNDLAMYRSIEFHDKINVSGIDEIRQLLIDKPEMKSGKRAPLNYMAAAHLLYSSVQSNHRDHHVSPFAPLPIESLERLGESKYSEGQMLTDRRKERGSTPMHPHVDEDEDENSEELAVRMSRLNYEIFLNNFLDNEKEYTYQTWNHFASRRLVSGIKRIRKKKKIVDDDFTEEEKLLKGILEKKDIKLISKDVCLTYQYSPECCFNSMVDVIPIRRLSKPLDVVDSTEKPKHITQVYNPRIFMEERDSLYQTGEFPLDTEPSKVNTRMGSFIREKMSKSAKLKMKIEVDSKYIKHKDMFPIRFPNCPKELIQRSYGNLKLRSFHRQKSPMSKEYHKLTSTSEDQITFDFLSDRFLTDFVEVDSKHIEHSMENPTDILPEDMYSGIIEMESNSDTVGILNWSGEQVYSKKIYKRRRTHQVVVALNFPDTEIWLRGCLGCIKTFRKYLRAFVESTLVDRFLTFCVLMNTFILMLEGLTSDDIGLFLDILNSVFTIIFILELFIKLSALGFKKYVQNYFNIFDAVIVCISIIEFSISLTTSEGGTTSGSKISAFRALRILRMFRVLRVTRILRSMKFMRVIVAVIVETAEQYTYVAIILLLFIYIYSLLGMQIYAGKLQYEDVKPRLNFDSFSAAAVTLFQLLTFENWTDVVEACYKSSVSHAVTMVFILSWLIIGNYIIFNLFLALLLGGFDSDNVIKSLEENTDEFKELQMGIIRQKELNLKEKERIKSIEAKQNKEVDYFIQSENNDGVGNDDMFIEFMDETQKKSRACYTVFRNTINDESSLQELMYNTLEERLRPRIFVKLIDLNRDIYDGVECDVSLFLFRKDNCFRIIAAHVVSHPWFEPVIMFLIVLSSMKLVVETYFSGNDNEKETKIFDWFDNIINCLFVLECVFKILRNGFILDKNCYLSDGWSWLDFLIMATSTLDMILTDLSLPMIKIFRTLRPLRFIARYKNMRVIVNSLLGVLGPLLNVTLVMMLVWLIFAILGMNFLGGKLGYCDIDNYYGVSKEQCEQLGQRWRRAFWNFDNIGESFVTLFVLVSMEGWPALVASSLDIGDSETSGPIYNNNPWIMIYYLAFILIGAMFLMDLFTGVIFYQYGIELEKEISMTCTNCTDDQVKWIMIQKLIYSASSNFAFIETPKNKLRYMFFKLVTSSYFEIALLLAVLLNIVIMGMDYEGMGDNYEKTLDIINDCLVWVFCLEFLLKLTAFGYNYFTDKWNIMDTVILALSIADFFMGILGISNNSKIAIGPQIARALRIIRITRLFKLFKSKHMEAFMKLINTLIFSLPTILNVFALLLVIYFIFAVIGCFIFKNADLPAEFDSAVLNFHNFHMGLLTLFRLSTGEDWPLVMYNYGESKGNYLIARIYFMVYIFITTFVMLNLFELVIVQIFESFYFDPDNVLASFEQISMEFNKAWNCFTVSTQGKKIKVENLPRFFAHLEEPLGFRVKEEDNSVEVEDLIVNESQFAIRKPLFSIAVIISQHNLVKDQEGYVSYWLVLQLALKFMYGNKALSNSTFDTYKFIKSTETGMIADRLIQEANSQKKPLTAKYVKSHKARGNPVSVIMNMKVVLAVWKEYAELWSLFEYAPNGKKRTTEEILDRIDQQRSEELEFYNQGFNDDGDSGYYKAVAHLYELLNENQKYRGRRKSKGRLNIERKSVLNKIMQGMDSDGLGQQELKESLFSKLDMAKVGGYLGMITGKKFNTKHGQTSSVNSSRHLNQDLSKSKILHAYPKQFDHHSCFPEDPEQPSGPLNKSKESNFRKMIGEDPEQPSGPLNRSKDSTFLKMHGRKATHRSL